MTDETLEAAVRLTEAFIARADPASLVPLGTARGSDEIGESVGQLFTKIYEAVLAAYDKSS